MHHLLPFYGRHQSKFLKVYINLAKLTRIPLLGRLVKAVANWYARRQHGGYVIKLEEAERIIDVSETVALGPCSCRQTFGNCQRPVMSEIIVGAGKEVYAEADKDNFKQITRQEAKEIMRQCHREGLLHTVMSCRGHYYSICNCCTCCCVPLRLKRDYGIEYAIIKRKDIVADYLNNSLGHDRRTDEN